MLNLSLFPYTRILSTLSWIPTGLEGTYYTTTTSIKGKVILGRSLPLTHSCFFSYSPSSLVVPRWKNKRRFFHVTPPYSPTKPQKRMTLSSWHFISVLFWRGPVRESTHVDSNKSYLPHMCPPPLLPPIPFLYAERIRFMVKFCRLKKIWVFSPSKMVPHLVQVVKKWIIFHVPQEEGAAGGHEEEIWLYFWRDFSWAMLRHSGCYCEFWSAVIERFLNMVKHGGKIFKRNSYYRGNVCVCLCAHKKSWWLASAYCVESGPKWVASSMLGWESEREIWIRQYYAHNSFPSV